MMTTRIMVRIGSAFAIAGLLAAGPAAFAGVPSPVYTVDFATVDGGGTTLVAGGAYALGGTVGQPDSGPHQTGGSSPAYDLAGGFWTALADAPAPVELLRFEVE